ncbi:hypothetical protein [Salinisphaera hydrothermalis]|uniref:hypothetical protein n=1 Tax=Salinisphaera hydrothermalis TaxID=563188 RepID=UPI0012EB5BD6|nr:hypothetical protein [Salinisphaera hydrothermalis]
MSTIIGSAAAVMIQKFPYQVGFFTYFFIVLVAVSVIFIALAALFLFKAFVGYEYARVPTPLTLKCHYDKLNAWHKKYGDGESAAERKFEESFNIRLGEATEKMPLIISVSRDICIAATRRSPFHCYSWHFLQSRIFIPISIAKTKHITYG